MGLSPSSENGAWEQSQGGYRPRTMAPPLKVRGIGASKHETDEYILEPLYFPAISENGQRVVVPIKRELHLVDKLRANILIGNDIIGPEGITMDIAKEKAYVPGCITFN